ncbi:hypothetical protein [Candidatus Palauibacter sp.]|uniref:hypothetical protein n=1 Tax=Candidatus Palauibacter sp. TaxID=3101350 RepID=UPI003D0D2555
MTIFGLRDPNDRNTSVDPSSVSGAVSVLLDVQYNDETVTGVDLMLGDNVISCRGASSDANQAIAGLVDSGGAVEIDCYLNTAAVTGECMGEQMDPAYANGDYALGARITTSDGTTRESLATQNVTLKNSGHVVVAHSAGASSVVKTGANIFGGPSGEGNMNAFHVCPVSYAGTDVGMVSLRALSTGAEKAEPHQPATSLSFKAPTKAEKFNGKAADREGPFTWDVNSAWNSAVEDAGPGGREHWVFAAETITDADGLDASEEFATENPYGPYYFDFKAPTAGPIHINKKAVEADLHYSASAGIALTGMMDAGSGWDATSITIAVGDCSNPANLPYNSAKKTPNRMTTPFVAAYADVSSVSELAEEDAMRAAAGQTDNNGLDCYVAELTAFADKLGNAWKGGGDPATWMQTPNFGVDKTAPVLSDIEPESGMVFKALPMMEFEVDNPDLESGDDGTKVGGKVTRRVGTKNVEVGSVAIEDRNGTVTLDGDNAYFKTAAGEASNGAKTVTVTVSDGATPANTASYSLSFGYDTKAPTVSISKSQSDIGQTGASSVTVSVAGTISDASEIESAALRLLLGDDVNTCAAITDTLPDNRTTGGDKRNLENGTNSIAFDESFVIKRPEGTGAGPETYCFRLDVEDASVEADARGKGTEETYNLGKFTVTWPAGPAPPPPGPTFQFHAAAAVTELDSLSVVEGATADNAYRVTLKNVPADATYPIEMTIDGSATVTPTITGGSGSDATQFGAATDTLTVTLATAHDRNIVSELRTLTHKAEDFDDADFPVRVMDDDFKITTNVPSVREDDDAVKVVVTVTAGSPQASDNALSVVIGPKTGTTDGDIATGSATAASVTIDSAKTVGVDTVEVNAADDGAQDEVNEFIELTVSGSDPTGLYYAPAEIMILDDDPDIELSLSVTEADEDAGNVAVTITATAKSEVGGQVNASIAIAGANGATFGAADSTTETDDARGTSPVALVIDAGETVGTANTTVTIVDDAEDDDGETIEFSAVNVTVGTKEYTFKSVKLKINDDDDDS